MASYFYKLFNFLKFYLCIYPLDPQESNGGAYL